MKNENIEYIVISIVIALAGIALGMVLDFKGSIPFYVIAIITVLIELVFMFIIVLKRISAIENSKK